MDTVFIITAAAVICIMLLTVRQLKPEMAVAAGVCTVCVLSAVAFSQLSPLIELIENAVSTAGITKGYLSVVLKGVGLCIMTQLASDICRSAGEASVASAVEVCGRIGVLILAVPLINDVLSVAISCT